MEGNCNQSKVETMDGYLGSHYKFSEDLTEICVSCPARDKSLDKKKEPKYILDCGRVRLVYVVRNKMELNTTQATKRIAELNFDIQRKQEAVSYIRTMLKRVGLGGEKS